jgi:hypothetical protein
LGAQDQQGGLMQAEQRKKIDDDRFDPQEVL